MFGFGGASAVSIRDELLAARYMTRFDGVVLFDYAMSKAHALNTVRISD
ncbi:hypothetical protein [Trinickia mobilis]|nr:hypothetical protein [Trinickia mobilis]